MKMAATPEKTFRAFSASQAANYALHRSTYSPHLYSTLLTHHTSTGGLLHTALDVGCGPGTVARDLAPHFSASPAVIALDPSEGMIAAARAIPEDDSKKIRFEVSTAETLGTDLEVGPVGEGSVDLIVAGTAAHWFDTALFWPRAARVLKPGGTVALWGSTTTGVEPSPPTGTSPTAAQKINALLSSFDAALLPYREKGNAISRSAYRDLPLPWDLDPPCPEFDEATFRREDFTKEEDFFAKREEGEEMGLDTMERMLGTGSPIVRWREANPGLEGTEEDLVRRLRRDVEGVLRGEGVKAGEERIRRRVQGFLLMVKRK